jgi:hypothetical protein
MPGGGYIQVDRRAPVNEGAGVRTPPRVAASPANVLNDSNWDAQTGGTETDLSTGSLESVHRGPRSNYFQ